MTGHLSALTSPSVHRQLTTWANEFGGLYKVLTGPSCDRGYGFCRTHLNVTLFLISVLRLFIPSLSQLLILMEFYLHSPQISMLHRTVVVVTDPSLALRVLGTADNFPKAPFAYDGAVQVTDDIHVLKS